MAHEVDIEWDEVAETVVVTREFDLGLIVRGQDGVERQLRAPDMAPHHLELVRRGRGSELIDQSIEVHVMRSPAGPRRVSSLAPAEHRRRQARADRERLARERAKLGDACRVRVQSAATETNEIYYCEQVDGDLVGALPVVEIARSKGWCAPGRSFPTSKAGARPLELGQELEVSIIAFAPWGGPYFALAAKG